eukprot:2253809-Pyramimonas_sp.AAC.1
MTKKQLRSAGDHDAFRTWIDELGRSRVEGGSGLKGAQAYPPGLGVEVALLHKEMLEYAGSSAGSVGDDVIDDE